MAKLNRESRGPGGSESKLELTPGSSLSSATGWLKQESAAMCTLATLQRRLPVAGWLPHYTLDDFVCDLIAGLTVGLTAIPQGIAYAVVAGLEPQYGLYSGFMGCFMYFFFGSSKDVTIGPTAIMALMTAPYVAALGPDFAVLLCFLSGCVILLFGILHLGFLLDFISMPVTAGFTSAAAVTIASSQLKGLLGLPGSANDFIDAWANTFRHIQETNLWDLLLGVVTIVILLLAKRMSTFDKGRDVSTMSLARKVFSKTVNIFSLARNAVVVVAGTFLAYILFYNDVKPFTLTGTVSEGLPPFRPPPFGTVYNNVTYTFPEMTKELGSAIFTIPIIAILESIAIAKAFANGKLLDATQEMIALGMCNIMGSFVSSLPVTGSFTRTAVNNASGVRTPLGGLFTGALVLLALGVLTSSFFFIPKATLAGLIICAMFYMVEYEVVMLLWRSKKLDLIPLLATFFCCLGLGLDWGIIIGIMVNLLYALYLIARPSVDTRLLTIAGKQVLLVKPEAGLVYPAAEFVRELVVSASRQESPVTVVVIDGAMVNNIDATMAKNVKCLVQDLAKNDQTVVLWNWKKQTMHTCVGVDKELVKYFRFETTIEELLANEADLEPETMEILIASESGDSEKTE